MSQTLLLECERLELNEQWMETMERLLSQFESYWIDTAQSEHVDSGANSHHDKPSSKHILDRPSFAFLETLRLIKKSDDDELRKVLICRAISRLPVFHLRVKSEGTSPPTFWDPLDEHLSAFIQRAEAQQQTLRYYTSEASLHGEDVIQTRVFEMLSVSH